MAASVLSDAGLSTADAEDLTTIYHDAQLSSLRVAFFGLIAISVLALFSSRGIPSTVPERRRMPRAMI